MIQPEIGGAHCSVALVAVAMPIAYHRPTGSLMASRREKFGLWMVRVGGRVGATVAVGISALKRGLTATSGMVTELPVLADHDNGLALWRGEDFFKPLEFGLAADKDLVVSHAEILLENGQNAKARAVMGWVTVLGMI